MIIQKQKRPNFFLIGIRFLWVVTTREAKKRCASFILPPHRLCNWRCQLHGCFRGLPLLCGAFEWDMAPWPAHNDMDLTGILRSSSLTTTGPQCCNCWQAHVCVWRVQWQCTFARPPSVASCVNDMGVHQNTQWIISECKEATCNGSRGQAFGCLWRLQWQSLSGWYACLWYRCVFQKSRNS